jgi:hypothetical protein
MARRPKPIDKEQVFKLARLGCSQAEIADVLGCSQPTISKRFRMELARARASFRIGIRRAQYIRAVKDRSDTMLIHLGKVELGQVIKADRGDLDNILRDLLGSEGGPTWACRSCDGDR